MCAHVFKNIGEMQMELSEIKRNIDTYNEKLEQLRGSL